MVKQQSIMRCCLSLGLVLGATVITPRVSHASHLDTSPANQFRQIEQPLWLKIGITLGGTGLVGLELWWFLLSRTKAQQAQITQGVQEIEIIVDGGYNPNQIVVRSGQPVRLKFQRKDPSSCLEQVLIPDFRRSAMLDLNQTTTIEFTPQKPGQYPFHCGMNMFRGVIFVKQA